MASKSVLELDELTSPDDDDLLLITETTVTVRCSDGVVSSGSLTRLTSAAAQFVASDSGKTVVVEGAGTGGVDHVAVARYINASTLALRPGAIQATTGADVSFPISKKLKWSTISDLVSSSESTGGWTYYPFQWSSANPTALITVPANKRVLSASIAITTAFNGTSPTLQIGTAASAGAVMTTAQNDPATVGTYETSPAVSWGSATALRLTLNAGVGASQGAGVVTLQIEE